MSASGPQQVCISGPDKLYFCLDMQALHLLGFRMASFSIPLDFVPASNKQFLDIQATIECGFTLKPVRDMTRTYSLKTIVNNGFLNGELSLRCKKDNGRYPKCGNLMHGFLQGRQANTYCPQNGQTYKIFTAYAIRYF